jgi:hypothetical protein
MWDQTNASRLSETEVRATGENERRQAGEKNENALHGKTSKIVYVLARNQFWSSPIPLSMEERCPLR